MIEPVKHFDIAVLDQFETVIDVRSPSEFDEDHVPGAMSLPVLTDEERAQVGHTYKQVSRFEARRMGAAFVARNIAHHIETSLANRPADFAPLIYCWRGGMRSNAMALIFNQIGWQARTLEGGYKTYRRHVQEDLYEGDLPFRFILLDGNTGTAKTAIINKLQDNGLQAIDLESLAEHRGSIFGGFGLGEQPSQKLFESRLWKALAGCDPKQPVFLEAESNKIGLRVIPPALWTAMSGSPSIEISAPVSVRAQHLVRTYPELLENETRLNECLEQLKSFVGKPMIDRWRDLARKDAFEALASELMEHHYDVTYQLSRSQADRKAMATLEASSLDESALNSLVDEIREKVA